ncbi:hypothetical protein DZF93_01470 [Clavibacter michiganensis subsp. insidiosus]|uniref:Uncharacterized protein n=1 Tax=Clavibacter michiganensis subsp. insidiosus TaxID=33014 RepID=A0A0D5CM97_9MICO|nr:hypothetical protein VO01_16160 [Clavibacter michiganensis subsp. insidiosus]AWF99967.1 hypothetical protein BEH61_15785 [Clavibacter michiganensis subsp. insidiosus]RIJ44793.1 hypothetical protein DZF93_01470 [Clavibacter michiganensis subsp. insidiosus]
MILTLSVCALVVAVAEVVVGVLVFSIEQESGSPVAAVGVAMFIMAVPMMAIGILGLVGARKLK